MKKIGFCFGGSSVEHEVSVISGIQAALATDSTRFEVVPIYISKDKLWHLGKPLLDVENYKGNIVDHSEVERVRPSPSGRNTLLLQGEKKSWFAKAQIVELDALFLVFHGAEGENGSFQGMCENWGVPYTGSGILGSSLSMDKDLSKIVCLGAGIPVVDYQVIRQKSWIGNEDQRIADIEAQLSYPIVVKPARLGSSIGISICHDRDSLDSAIEDAFRYDEKIVVEYGVKNLREINCSVLGSPGDAQASVLEQPVTSVNELLSFEDKYQRGGDGSKGGSKYSSSSGMASLDRLIPAPLSNERTKEIRELALEIFSRFECSGVCRIDFMIDKDTDILYFNEINTIPGSLAFYLWKASGMSFQEMNSRLIEIAFERSEVSKSKISSYDTNLLETSGLKGIKK